MIDIPTLTALATSAVTILTPLLQKAVEAGGKELGKSTAGLLFEKLKTRLTHAGAKEALSDLEKQPADADLQSTLRVQLRKALEGDAELAAQLKQWIAEVAPVASTSQVATTHGDNNKTTQILGSGNQVSN